MFDLSSVFRFAALSGFALALLAGCGSEDAGSGGANPAPAPTATEPAAKPTPPKPDTPAGPKVAFVGDSITAGLHLEFRDAFPSVVRETLRAAGIEFSIINAGVSGDTTAGGVRRIDWILRQSPDLVVLELGGNDGLRGVPLEDIERNLRAIVNAVNQAGGRTLLLGMRIPPSYGAEYSEGFSAIYERLAAEEESAELVPYFMEGVGGVPEMMLADGIHPTAEGHRKLAATLAPFLTRALAGMGVSAVGSTSGGGTAREQRP